MSIEVIKVIKEAEEKAEAIKKDAAAQARQVITNANVKAQEILDEARKKAESEGQLLYDGIINDAARDCDEILTKSGQNMDKAASIILERIVKTSDNS